MPAKIFHGERDMDRNEHVVDGFLMPAAPYSQHRNAKLSATPALSRKLRKAVIHKELNSYGTNGTHKTYAS